jgi:dihydroorotase
VELLSVNPRKIFGLPQATIAEGAKANVTVFDPEASWVYDTSNKQSLGINSPWIGKELTGAVYS